MVPDKEGTVLDCRSGSGFVDQLGNSVAVAAGSSGGIDYNWSASTHLMESWYLRLRGELLVAIVASPSRVRRLSLR